MIGYPAVEAWSQLATRVLAPNPGRMTLEGTNTYVVRAPGSHRTVVVDPGPEDQTHLRALLACGQVELILLTHRHTDHADSAPSLSARTGAPVRAFDRARCVNADPLVDGQTIFSGGVEIRVYSTPGHTTDSVCFHLPGDRDLETSVPTGAMLTGDTVLGRGTTALSFTDGSLADHIRSLERLRSFGDALVLPGHGPAHAQLAALASSQLEHRWRRLRLIAEALTRAGAPETTSADSVELIVGLVYPDVSPDRHDIVRRHVAGQLALLASLSEPAFTDLLEKGDAGPASSELLDRGRR